MKAAELRELNAVELNKKLGELKKSCSTCAFSMPSTSWTTPAVSRPSRRTSPA